MGVAIPQIVSATEDRASGALVIDGGLRFDSNKNHSLKRLPTSNGSKTTWTWSGWVKRSDLPGAERYFWGAYYSSLSRYFLIGFNSSHQLYIFGGDYYTAGSTTTNINVNTNAVFRDTSAFYHIIVAYDTTQATSTNRIKVYVNGVLQQLTITNTPSQNSITFVNSSDTTHYVGAYDGSYQNFNGQMTNVYLIDGQALDPSYFGYTDPITNTWRPKKLKSGAATINDGRTWSSNYGNLRTAGTQTNPFDADNTNYAQVSVGGGGYFTFPDGLNGRLEVLASTGQSSDGASTQTVTISNNSGAVASRTTSKGYNTGPEAIDFGVVSGITSVFLTDSGLFWGFRINSITLRDGITETIGFGTNGFYLPLDGNTPIGQDQSGRGNNWTPVNFGGSNTIEKATGALPILNTDGGGKVARVGVRTDSNASSLVLALPLVGIKSDFSNAINSGTSNKAITANGNAAASSAQSNFYGGSFYFDGTGDYLSIPSSSDFAFGTGDFTIEFHSFFAASSLPANATFYSNNYTGTQGVLIQSSSAALYFYVASSSVYTGNVLVAQKWQHIAITRSSGTISIFVDGVLQASGTLSGSAGNSSVGVTIAAGSNGGTGFELNGYIQDFRIYKGLAKYTQNFIPASTDPDILPDTPSGVAYSSNVALVPSTDGAVAFGSGRVLTTTSSADFNFGTGDFTIEYFLYRNSLGSNDAALTNYSQVSSGYFMCLHSNSTDAYLLLNGSTVTSGGTAEARKWIHYAYVRSGTTCTIYKDGISIASATSSAQAGATNVMNIGAYSDGSSFIDGFISNLHIVKGTALYTSNFTPPTGPISSVANTKLLCCKSNSSATAFDVSPGTITANGNTVATNFNPFTVNINTQRGQESGYCTLNPLFIWNGTHNLSFLLSDGNLQFTQSSSTNAASSSSIVFDSGKWYWEVVHTAFANSSYDTATYIATDSGKKEYDPRQRGVAYLPSGNKKVNDSNTSYGSSYAIGDVIGIAFDADSQTVTYYKNGISQGSISGITNLSGYSATVLQVNGSDILKGSFNFGQKPFKFPPPAGFQPLALANTPRPSIVRPDQYVGIVTYTGNGSTQSVNTGFKPDFVWVKCRTASVYHALFDSVRGTNKRLGSNETSAEQDQSPSGLSSFNSNGFTVVDGSTGGNGVNGSPGGLYAGSTAQYVAWAWKAGGNSNTFNINDIGYSTASAAGLTAGTITPTGASVNTKSGFSIIKYTTPSSASSFSVPHGLTKKPNFAIFKSTASSGSWVVWHDYMGGNTGYLLLNTTDAFTSQTQTWGSSDPTSSVFNFGTTAWWGSSNQFIGYIWHDVPGFSKFGVYTGNNSADGPLINLGFKPALFMHKDITTGGANRNWLVWDKERNSYNPMGTIGFWNLSTGDSTDSSSTGHIIDFVSNGVKIRNNNTNINPSSTNFIYVAWAETPSFNLYGGQANAR